MPELRIILDHLGGVKLDGKPLAADWIANFRAVAREPNIHCKVSALFGRWEKQPATQDLAAYQEVLDLAFEYFGEDRLIFGSDWPVTEQTAGYASVLRLTRAYFDSKGPDVSAKLFHQNAEAFYRPPTPK
jgi:predicted TIM-barrel fold metal-dependent hydrolase